ncbi:hypothetical protein E2L08_16540 [Palleronia sediminis]|uniref:Transposase n=1 Tax=Palleronia sediminis TaxID=2547833 RepID=A0A4R6A0P7_9RHOB|nr:hypothetical protein E2L08_16540 [Palleronia sediminis]
MAESYVPGVLVGDVALWHELLPSQLTTWRRHYRQGELVPRGSTLRVAQSMIATR